MLNDNGDLAIAELIFWIPAFFLTVACCFRQGFKRQSAWVSIGLLGLARIIGAGCLIAYETESNPDTGLATAAAITGSLGLSFMLSVMAGSTIRLLETMKHDTIVPPRIVRLIYLVITIAIIIGIVGATKISGTDVSQDDINDGYNLLKASTILYLIVFLGLVVLMAITWTMTLYIVRSQRPLLWAITISAPLILVRLLYSLLAVFSHGSEFNLFAPNVWAQAFMQVAEEMILAVVFIFVGFILEPPDVVKSQQQV